MFHPTTPRQNRSLKLTLVGLAVSACALSAVPAWSQTTAPTMGDAVPAAPADASKLAYADRNLLIDLAQSSRAEVEAGKIALEKSQTPEVKKFAQDMVDGHSKALSSLEQLGAAKNVKLPDGVGVVNKAKETALKALSGRTFDSQYLKRAGVGGHETTVALLQKIQQTAKDPDLKQLADQLLPEMQRNLDAATQLVPA